MTMRTSSLQKGLVLYLPLDQQSYNPSTKRFSDGTPHENHGTAALAAVFENDRMDRADRATVFNGSSDFINCGNDPSLDITDEITISLWAKYLDATNNYKRIITKNKESAYCLRTGAADSNNRLEFNLYIGGSIQTITSNNTLVNQYNHIVAMYNGTIMKMYVNGILQTNTKTISGNIGTNNDDLLIAKRVGVTHYLDGSLADVRIYNRALSPSEITQLYEEYRPKIAMGDLQKGLVLHLPLDEQSYNPATKRFSDGTPYENHGTGANAANFDANDRMGQADRATVFNGLSDYVSVSDNNNLDITTAITMSLWLKWTSPIVTIGVICKDDASVGAGYGLYAKNDGKIKTNMRIDGSWKEMVDPNTSNDNNWHHFVVIYDGSKVYLYRSGIEVVSDDATGNISTNNYNFKIGTFEGSSDYFNGTIADVRIYNRALTQAEITQLYEEYRPKLLM